MQNIIFFDFDGVIVDSFDISYEAAIQLFQEPLTQEQYRKFFEGNIYEEFFKTHSFRPGMQATDYLRLYRSRILEQEFFGGVPEALKAIHSKYPEMFLVSSTFKEPIQEYLQHHDLASYFKDLQGGDTHPKKDVKMRNILKASGAKPTEAVMVTDTLGDIHEAASAGVGSIAIAWGFHDKERLLKGKPRLVVETPGHLPAAIDDYFAGDR